MTNMYDPNDWDWWIAANWRRQLLINLKHEHGGLTPDQEQEYRLLQEIAEVIVNEKWRRDSRGT
jgi:hypothetical protein